MTQVQAVDELVGRELLLDVACRLFMEDGYDGVSMQQIASAANMTKGSPYYHFKGKKVLFLHAFVAQVQRINEGFLASLVSDGSLREQLVAAFTHLLRTTDPGMIRMLDDYRRLFEGQCTPGLPEIEATPEVMRRAYQQALSASGEPLRQSSEQLADALMALQLGTVHMRVIHPGMAGAPLTEQEAHRISRDTIELFLDGAIVAN